MAARAGMLQGGLCAAVVRALWAAGRYGAFGCAMHIAAELVLGSCAG